MPESDTEPFHFGFGKFLFFVEGTSKSVPIEVGVLTVERINMPGVRLMKLGFSAHFEMGVMPRRPGRWL